MQDARFRSWLTCVPIYMYRLLIEYARIIDDNRDRIGYAGDGVEVDRELELGAYRLND